MSCFRDGKSSESLLEDIAQSEIILYWKGYPVQIRFKEKRKRRSPAAVNTWAVTDWAGTQTSCSQSSLYIIAIMSKFASLHINQYMLILCRTPVSSSPLFLGNGWVMYKLSSSKQGSSGRWMLRELGNRKFSFALQHCWNNDLCYCIAEKERWEVGDEGLGHTYTLW